MKVREIDSRFTTGGDGPAPWKADRQTSHEDSSLGELLKRLSENTGDLISQEIALAKAELKESATQVAKGTSKLIVAWMFGLTGLIALTAFAIVGLGNITGGNYAIWALAVGVAEMIIAAIAANGARKSMRGSDLKPAETIETLREAKGWAKREAKDLKRDITESPVSSHQN